MLGLGMMCLKPPIISREQLGKIAGVLSVKKKGGVKELKNDCFNRAFSVCQKGEWDLIDPIVRELSLLVDSVGRTLLLKAAIQQNDEIVRELVERGIGLFTKDQFGNTILFYLTQKIAGASTDDYFDLIIKKVQMICTDSDIFFLIKGQGEPELFCNLRQEQLKFIACGNTPADEAIQVLKNLIEYRTPLVEPFDPEILNYLFLLEKQQKSLKMPEAEDTRKEYETRFSLLYGFLPVPLEEYSEAELLEYAQNGNEREIVRFLDSCVTRFIAIPEEIPTILKLLYKLAKSYWFLLKDGMVIRITNTMLLVPKAFQRKDPGFFANMIRQAGICHFRLPYNREYKKAEDLLNEALNVCNQSSDVTPFLRYRCYHDRAALYLHLGQLDQAESDERKVVDFSEKNTQHENPNLFCNALVQLASILFRAKKFNEAHEFAKKASEQAKLKAEGEEFEIDDLHYWTNSNFSRILLALGQVDKALKHAQMVVYYLQKMNTPKSDEALQEAWLELGNVWFEKRNYLMSFANYEKAIEEATPDSRLYPIIAFALGACYLAYSNYQKAEEWSKKASEIYTKFQWDLSHDEWQVTFFGSGEKAHRIWECALVCQGKLNDALIVSDKRRARALVNNLSRKVFPGQTEVPDLNLKEIYSLAQQLKTVFVVYSVYKSVPGHCWVISPEETINTVKINQVSNIFPEGLDALLSEAPYIGRNVKELFPVIDLYEILNLCEEERDGLLVEESNRDGPPMRGKEERRQSALAKLREKIHAFLKECYKEFIKPIEEYLPKSPELTITFIPDGPMTVLPFSIFERSDGRYFIEDHTCLVAPSIKSVSLLEELRKQRSGKESSGKSIVVGNPTTHKDLKLNALSYAEIESVEIGKILGTSNDCLKIGSGATIDSVISMMQQAQWIHFACHGSCAKKEGQNSVYNGLLYFTPEQKHPKGELYAEAISKMNFEAELAFLSACYSGRGNTEHLHEGLIGLTRALASGGVLTSVSSYWKLSDSEETVELIKTFYNHIFGNGVLKVGKAVALRQAMLKAIEKNREDPYKWGALFLTGLN